MLFVRFALAGTGGVPWTVVVQNIEQVEFSSERTTVVKMVGGEAREVEGSVEDVVALCGGTFAGTEKKEPGTAPC